MPTYSYKCTACGHAFDAYQSFSEDALTVCPECRGALRKVFSPVGVAFKGSGFYRTDSRTTSSGSSPASPKAESTTSDSSSSKSTSSDGGSTSKSAATSSAGSTQQAQAS